MKTLTIPTSTASGSAPVTTGYSLMERMVLRRAHPISIMLGAAGAVLAVTFLWQQNWLYALISIIAARLAAYLVLRNANLPALAETPLGKIGLLHLHPVNLTIQSIGAVVAIYGLWTHSTEAISGGLAIIFAGHLFGWSKVDPRFGL